MDIISLLRGILGIIILLGISFLLSNNKKKINWRLVLSGLGLQIVFAILILKGEELSLFFKPFGWPKDFFYWISGFFVSILNFTTEGAK
ncbi:MAG: Na+ dependent nucleoside transporter N-terminal domain-containing protein, partial [Ignavibacteriaceae bacterium]